jgi:hypothetical protein
MIETSIKKTIGRAEVIAFPELGVEVHARIDSGARTSAIWASQAVVEDGKLAVVFFGEGHPAYTGEKHYFNVFDRDIVISSTGHRDPRYKVKLSVILKKRKIRASFTLANRSTQVYPVLVGRNILRGKFIVDVQYGKTLATEEKELLEKKRIELNQERETS